MTDRRTLARLLATAVALGIASVSPAIDSPQAAPRLLGPGIVSTGENEFGPAFLPDGKTLFFCRTAPARSNYQAILVSRRVDGKWGTPSMAPFSGEWKDIDPSISLDGKLIVFASNRPLNGGEARKDYDLWGVDRTAQGWSAPRHLGPLVNSDGDETTTSIASDGTLTLASSRTGGKGRRDLYTSKSVDGVYQAAEPITSLNTEFDDSNQFIAPDQSFLVFASDRGGKPPNASSEFYLSLRKDGVFGEPRKLGAVVNGTTSVLTPTMTPDGKTFVFASFRGFADTPLGRPLSVREMSEKLRAPGNGLGDLYEVDAAAVLDGVVTR
ncbi:MAG: hypothetical protein ABIT01_19225 [Thermoanaerobaculia bacterium]